MFKYAIMGTCKNANLFGSPKSEQKQTG